MELLRILFFSKVVLLTPQPVDIPDRLELIPAEPLKAITSGAHLEVDVSAILGEPTDIVAARQEANRLLPAGTVYAVLYGEDGKALELRYGGAVSTDGKRTWIVLTADGGVAVDSKFARVLVVTSVPMRGITVSWRNHKT